MQKYYSDDWQSATIKFANNARKFGDVKWCVANNHKYDIPYVSIGDGPNKVVIYSGISGLDAFYGSAAQNMFLDKFAPLLTQKMLEQYTIVLIHVVNGWGMDNKMHETIDDKRKLIDLNRNFRLDFKEDVRDVRRDQVLRELSKNTMNDKFWSKIYQNQNSLFYGGAKPAVEHKMLLSVMDKVMSNAQSLQSVGLATSSCLFDKTHMRVYHDMKHPTSSFYGYMCWLTPVLNGFNDMTNIGAPYVLEEKYQTTDVPVYAAEFCVGTRMIGDKKTSPERYVNMGNARIEKDEKGKISSQTQKKLMDAFCPTDKRWRKDAMTKTSFMYQDIMNHMDINSRQK